MRCGANFFLLPIELRTIIWKEARKQVFNERRKEFACKFTDMVARRKTAENNGRYELHLHNGDYSFMMIIVKRPAYWNRLGDHQYMCSVFKNDRQVYYAEQWNNGKSWQVHRFKNE